MMNKTAQFAKGMMQTLQWKKVLCVVLVVLAAIKTIQIFFPQYVSGREEQLFAAIKAEPSVATRCGDFKGISVIKRKGNTTFALENRKNFAAQSYFNVIGEKAAIEVQVNWQEVEGVFSINSIYPVP